MVSPDLILTTPETAPIPTELSALCAVSTAIAMRVQKDSMTRYCRYLERRCAANQDEFAALSMKTALAREPSFSNTAGSFCPITQSEIPSCRFAMLVAQHSTESLAPFDWETRIIHEARRNREAVAQTLMVTFTMIVC